MNRLLYCLMLISAAAHAQDIVKLSNGAELNVKILGNNAQTISFSRGIPDAPPYYIAKNEIDEIRYENGTVEKPEHPEMSVEQAKAIVTEQISAWATDRDGNKVSASFEGNYLKITADAGDYKKGMVFDLLKLIRFEETAYRREGFAFINIWAPIRTNEAKNQWGKFKLVLGIATHENAAILTSSIKQLNKTLKANR